MTIIYSSGTKKGVLAKGVSAGSSVTPKEQKILLGHWPQQYIWHSQRDGQEGRVFLQKPPSKNPLFLADTGALCDTFLRTD